MKKRLAGLSAATLLALAGSATVAATRQPSVVAHPAGSAGGIELRTTLAAWTSGALPCGDSSTLGISAGDRYAVCYTVTNHSGHELDWHYLRDSLLGDGVFFDQLLNQPLADGASLTYTVPAAPQWSNVDITSTWTAEDAPPPDYSFDDSVPIAFVDLSASPTARLLMSADGSSSVSSYSADVPMPFTFRFYEKATVDVLCVGFLGVILVDQPGCDPFPHFDSNFGMMPTGFMTNLVAPAWTVWNSTLTGGTVYADTQGAAPNRRLIVEWRGMTRDLPGPGITFEAIFEEATGTITYVYQSMAFNDGGDGNGFPGDFGGSATAGIQRSFGQNGPPIYTQYSWWEQVLTDGKAIRWTPAAMPYAASATASAHVEILAPAVSTSPAAIEASVPAGGSATSTLTIGNTGNIDLNWTLSQTPAGTGFHFTKSYAAPQTPASGSAPGIARPRSPASTVVHPASAQQTHAPSAAVPAYAIRHGATPERYVSLNALAPQTLTEVNGDVNGEGVQVGGFIDNDFSREYLLNNGGCNFATCWNFEFQSLKTMGGGGVSSVIGSGITPSAGHGESWHGMKWDATTRTVYATASTDAVPSRTDLYSIDPHLGTPTWIAQVDDVGANGTRLLDIAIAPNGAMYGVDEWTDTLYAIDKSNGHVSPIGATGLDAGYYDLQSLDFDQSSGVLYYAAFPLTPTVSSMYTLDLATGHASLIGPIGDGTSALRGFAIAIPGGPCVDPHDVPWLSFDRSAGTTSASQSENVSITFNASGLEDGVYRAKICVSSNTPFISTVAVPATFIVGNGDRLFANGFE